jgi:type IV pilus assembly protein PilC
MRFTYTAQDKYGRVIKGEIEARDNKSALNLISSRGLTPITISAISGASHRASKFTMFFGAGRLKVQDMLFITRHLSALLDSGTDLLSALSIIEEEAPNSLIRIIVGDVKIQIIAGKTLADALTSWKKYFDPIFLNLVKAGEASGNLPATLRDYAAELRQTNAFMRKVQGAFFYPAILISALLAMMVLMLWLVMPRLEELFRSTGVQPQWYTNILFFLSRILRKNTILVAILFFTFILLFIFSSRHRGIRRYVANIVRHLPYISRIQNYFILRVFTRTLSRLLKAGIDLRRALLITSDAVGPIYGEALRHIAEIQLERGESLSNSLKSYRNLFPVLLISSVAAGERSGNIALALDQLAEFYEEETFYALEHFVTIIEPVLIVIVGIIVGLMAGSLISPLYRFVGRRF